MRKKMFKVFTLVLMALMSNQTFAAHKYDFEYLNVFFNITSSANLTVEVTYGSDYGQYFGPVNIPKKASYNGVWYTVTSVGNHAFSGCSGLTNVTFPETVTSIGNYAFSGCNAMMEMTIPGTITSIGNYAFNVCSSLKSIVFEFDPTPLKLGYGSSKGQSYSLFSDCPLQSLEITRPLSYSTNSSYGYSPFAKHPTLKKVVYKNWVNTGSYLLYGCDALTSVVLPDFMTTINDYTFYGCKSLKNISLPEKITSIGNSAFRNCNGFTSFTIGSGVETIGEYCFAGCISLKSFTFPVNLTKIGNFAFNGCTAIKELSFEHGGNKNLEIGSGASNKLSNSIFYDCPLESVTLARGLHYSTSSSYGYSPFANHPTLKSFTFNHLKNTGSYMLYGCAKLTSVNLGNMITINDYAFANCKSLSVIDIPATVTTIGNSAFRNCNWFNLFKIGTGVETIGDYCFAGCIGLDAFTIPGNVTKIGNYAFLNCTEIKKVIIEKGTTALTLGYGASKSDKGLFYDCPLESVTICRGLSYNTSSSYGYSPFAYNSTLATATFGDGATRISNYLFCGDAALSSVTMTKEMTAIGNYALYGCVGIKSFVMGVKNKAGDVLYSSVETIGDYAFSGCTNLTGLIFPPTLKSIGNYAFRNCTSFTNFAMEEGTEVLSLGNGSSEGEKTGLFRDCPINDVFIGRNLSYSYSPLRNIATLTVAKIGNPVTRIPNYIFQGDKELVTLHFNKSCKLSSIGKYAFAGCSKLPPYIFPETLTSIDEGAFQNCVGLNSFTFGENVETIGAYAFDGCKQLTSLVFPSSVKSIGNFAFNNCTGLTKIELEDGTATLTLGYGNDSGNNNKAGKGLFNDCPLTTVYVGRPLSYSSYTRYGYSPFARITSLKDFQMGETVVTIGSQHLRGCIGIESLVIPDNVTSIELSAFIDCSGLKSITLSPNLKTIANYVFYGCTSLTKMEIPASVTSIGNYAFGSCSNLTELFIQDGDKTLTMGYGASKGDAYGLFYDCPLESLYLGRTLSYTGSSKNGYSPFAKLNLLSEVTIGPQVTAIGWSAFHSCPSITELYIPSSVRKIDSSFSWNCSGLKKVIILGSTPPTTDTNNTLLYGTGEGCRFYVFYPDKYKSTKPWSNYANKIEPICEFLSNFTYSGDQHLIAYKTDFPITFGNMETSEIDAGTYTKHMTLTYKTNGYRINDVLDYNYTIKKAPLTITAQSCTREEGEENPEFQFDYDGFVNKENETVLTKEPVATTKATKSSPVGEYEIVVSGAEAKNYEISYVSGVLTVEKATAIWDNSGDNVISVSDVETYKGATTDITIDFTNKLTDLMGFQFDLTLPEGITLAKDANNSYLVSKTDRYSDVKQILEVTLIEENTYRIMCYSSSNKTITGTSGALLNLSLSVADNIGVGKYQGLIENSALGKIDGTQLLLYDTNFNIQVDKVGRGDANADGSVNVADLAAVVNYIMGKAGNDYDKDFADVNRDGNVNVADIAAVVNVILYGTVTPPAKARQQMNVLDPQ